MISARLPGQTDRGEGEALLRSHGGFLPQWSPAWRIGDLSLSAASFAFAQPGRRRFVVPLARISSLAMDRRKFVVLQKDVVRLTYVLPGQRRPRLVWFITADVSRWMDELVALTRADPRPGAGASEGTIHRPVTRAGSKRPAPVSEDQVESLAAAVGSAGARILRYLWRQRHADIEDLTRVGGLPSHMDMLTLLREGINGPAQDLLGGPIVVFRERALDELSGRTVCFHWWLRGAGGPPGEGADSPLAGLAPQPQGNEMPAPDPNEPLVEIHDEGEVLLLVVTAPGIRADMLRAPQVVGDRVVLTLDVGDEVREAVVSLPCRVGEAPVRVACSNSVMSLWLPKESEGGRK